VLSGLRVSVRRDSRANFRAGYDFKQAKLPLFRELFNSGFFDVLLTGLVVCAPKCLGSQWTEIWRLRLLFALKDVRIEHRSQQQRDR